MQRLHKSLFFAVLAAIYLFGSYASLKVGLTWDEISEAVTTGMNFNAVEGILHGDMAAYYELLEYNDRYYGVGFHIPAIFFQALIAKPVAGYFGLDPQDAMLLAKHWAVFNLFFCSAFLIRYLMRRCTGDEIFSSLATVGYLLWPFVFGHAMMNVKDIPFMVAWLLCTTYTFSMAGRFSEGQALGRRSVILLAILTGWLISIRFAGFLVFLQYMIMVFFFRGGTGKNISARSLFPLMHIPTFLFSLIIFCYLSYPVFWKNPLDVMTAIQIIMATKNMTHHTTAMFNVCTITYGHCVNGTPPAFYIPAWLSVKLPVMVIAGYLILPLTFMKIAGRADEPDVRFFKAVLITTLSVPLLLIIRHVVLYNEIRQLLFLMPLFYCVGVLSLYFVSRKAAIAALVASICIFTADHILAFPYQYVWFNEVARQFKVEKYFETDYWGASSRGLANQLTSAAKRFGPLNCIYADPDALIRPFMGKDFTGCFQWLYNLTPASPRPYLTASFSKTSVVVNCPEVQREKFRLFLGNESITIGRVQYCK